ncbi:MAG: J domain-containing protein [Paludibacter sp.]
MIDLTMEHKMLQLRYDILKKEFPELFALKNDMLSQEEQVLTALYLTAVGQKQHQKYCLTVEIKMIIQRISLFQAYFNRNEKPDLDIIEQKMEIQFAEYQQKIAAEAKRISLAKAFLKEGFLSFTDVKKLKEVYRLIVKKLHPDINPQVTELEKDLFVKAQAAYDLCDLAALEAILLSLDIIGSAAPVEPINLKAQVAILEEHVSKLKDLIAKLEKQFPFIYREKLADEVWIAAEKQQLDNDIEALNIEKKKYSEYILLLEEWKPELLS